MEDNLSELLAVAVGEGATTGEITRRQNQLVEAFSKIKKDKRAMQTFINIDAGYRVLTLSIYEFAEANIELIRLGKETKIEGDVYRIWTEYLDHIQRNLDLAELLLQTTLFNKSWVKNANT